MKVRFDKTIAESLDARAPEQRTPGTPSSSSWVIAGAAALPILCFAVYVAMTVIADTRSQLEQNYTAMARALLSSVDAELQSELRTLQSLATTPALQAGDFAAFHAQARLFAAAHGDWPAIVLTDPAGNGQLLNTAADYTGTQRPILERDSVLEAARTRKPLVGPVLTRGVIWPHPIIVLRVPVIRNDEVVFVLSAAISPTSIATIMEQQKASPDTLITIFDHKLQIVARSDGDRYIGQSATESIRQHAASGQSSLFLNYTLDGGEYRRVLVTSPLTRWSVAVGMRREAFDRVLALRALRLTGVGALAMLVATLGVLVLGRRFSRRKLAAERQAADQLRRVNRDLALAREQAEERALRAERLQADLEAVMNAVPVVVHIAQDTECRSIVGNRFADALFKVPHQTNVSLSAPDTERAVQCQILQNGHVIAPHDLPLQQAARGVEVRDWESELILTDGTVKTIVGNASPLRHPNGTVYGAVGAFLDVTERKRLEADLRAQQEKLKLFVEGVPAGIAMFDTGMIYLAASRRYAEDFLCHAVELIGRCHYDIFPEIPESWRAIHRRCLAGETLRCEEDMFRRADGRMDWVRWEIRPWYAAPDRIGGIILFCELITARKEIEAELRAAKMAAEEASEAKSRFLASVSHDLRQPIMAQRLLLHVACSHAETLEQASILARVGEALDGTEHMLSRLMDLATLELGRVPVQREVFRLDTRLTALLDETAGMAEKKGLLLHVWVMPCWTDSDPVLLGRIVRNLVINAVRYTDRGMILLAIRRRGDRYRIEVRDSGTGIPDDQQKMIFEEFRQLGNPERSRNKGQGLGLAIVARTAELLGHRLFLRSAPGRGSVFAIEVPAVAGPTKNDPVDVPLPPVVPQPTQPARILLIEDDQIQAMALAEILSDCGHSVTIAGDVARALAAIPQRLDLIITDYRLPGNRNGLDGIAAVRRTVGRPIPAILLTGDTQPAVTAAAAAAGTELLHKPCTPEAIIAAVAQHIAPPRGAA